jgi:hypothetical protein
MHFWDNLEKAMAADPKNSDAYFHTAEVTKHLIYSASKISATFYSFQNYLLCNNLERALSYYEIACNLSPNSPGPYASKLYTEFKLSVKQNMTVRRVGLKNLLKCLAIIIPLQGNFARHSSLFEAAIARFPRSIMIYGFYAQVF